MRAGKFKPPIGYERLQSATDINFAERGLPTNLVPSRDVGLQIGGEVANGVFEYQVGIFNGAPDLANGDADLNDSKDLAARVFVQPIRPGALRASASAISGSTGVEQGSTTAHRPRRLSLGVAADLLPLPQRPAGAGEHRDRGGAPEPALPHAYLGLGSFGVLGEYV